MKRLLRTLSLATALTAAGCLGDIRTDDTFRQQLIVEGRIEADGPAEVLLTTNLAAIGTIAEETLEGAVVRWAKVTVSDGERSEVLTGYRDECCMTGFVYRSNRILGRTGGRYVLTVEYSGLTLKAETTIPEPVGLDEVEAVKVDGEHYTVRARFRDPEGKNAYLFECRTEGGERETRYFRPALLGIVDDSLFPDHRCEVTVNRPLDYVHIGDYSQYFHRDERVVVRFSALGDFGYRFWSLFEDEVLNALNPVFPSTANLPSNIEGGGRGIWCGYASSRYEAHWPESQDGGSDDGPDSGRDDK